jgi:hypothetical protein
MSNRNTPPRIGTMPPSPPWLAHQQIFDHAARRVRHVVVPARGMIDRIPAAARGAPL